jgi:hypothetical protein
MLRDKAGNRLFRTVKVKVLFPDDIFPPKMFIQHVGPKQGFGPDGLDQILMSIADQLEQLYPFWEFKHQELLPEGRTARYLISFAGYNVSQITNTPSKESNTLAPVEPEDITEAAIKAAVGNTLQELAPQVGGSNG